MDMAMATDMAITLKARLVSSKALIVIVIIVNVKKDIFIVEVMEKEAMVSLFIFESEYGFRHFDLKFNKFRWSNILSNSL